MRRILISALMLSTVAVAAPAAAQYRGGGNGYGRGGAGIERQLDQIERQIDNLRDRRLISREEAFRLQRQAEQIDRLQDRFARNGVSPGERRELEMRLNQLRQRVQAERREGRVEDRRDRRW